MQLHKFEDRTISVLHTGEIVIGDTLAITDPDQNEPTVIAQVVKHSSFTWSGLETERAQRVLEESSSPMLLLGAETGMDMLDQVRVAIAKPRLSIINGAVQPWTGHVPSGLSEIKLLGPSELTALLPDAESLQLPPFLRHNRKVFPLDARRLEMVNLIVGQKDSGKSHMSKHLVIGMAALNAPIIIFDPNNEYSCLANVQSLRWGQDFLPALHQVGPQMLIEVVQQVCPLLAGSPSELNFKTLLADFFTQRETECLSRGEPYTIDLPYLLTRDFGSGNVGTAVITRLETINRLNLFWSATSSSPWSDLTMLYENACRGCPMNFELHHLTISFQKSLVASMLRLIERISADEHLHGTRRYPTVIVEEAQQYISEESIRDLIARCRHLGIQTFFITNAPSKLPDCIFSQLDNLFLTRLTHQADIEAIGSCRLVDQETISAFATRMPTHHVLVVGKLTGDYPMLLSVDGLPLGTTTGGTRSIWRTLEPVK